MYWNAIDKRLIKLENFLTQIFESYDSELSILNNNKIRHPFKIIDRYGWQ